MPVLDFIEIGCCDFETLFSEEGRDKQRGIVVEPIKDYFDKIPDCFISINAAVSDYTGTASVFWVSAEDITRRGLPQMLRGCSSIGSPNPFMLERLAGIGAEGLIRETKIPVITVADIAREHGIESCHYMKTDTEGHDWIIIRGMVRDFRSGLMGFLPEVVRMEMNTLTSQDNKDAIHRLMLEARYDPVKIGKRDRVYRLKEVPNAGV